MQQSGLPRFTAAQCFLLFSACAQPSPSADSAGESGNRSVHVCRYYGALFLAEQYVPPESFG